VLADAMMYGVRGAMAVTCGPARYRSAAIFPAGGAGRRRN
jgi:hypothetical protein